MTARSYGSWRRRPPPILRGDPAGVPVDRRRPEQVRQHDGRVVRRRDVVDAGGDHPLEPAVQVGVGGDPRDRPVDQPHRGDVGGPDLLPQLVGGEAVRHPVQRHAGGRGDLGDVAGDGLVGAGDPGVGERRRRGSARCGRPGSRCRAARRWPQPPTRPRGPCSSPAGSRRISSLALASATNASTLATTFAWNSAVPISRMPSLALTRMTVSVVPGPPKSAGGATSWVDQVRTRTNVPPAISASTSTAISDERRRRRRRCSSATRRSRRCRARPPAGVVA